MIDQVAVGLSSTGDETLDLGQREPELATLLTDSGFEALRSELLDLDPPAAGVIGRAP